MQNKTEESWQKHYKHSESVLFSDHTDDYASLSEDVTLMPSEDKKKTLLEWDAMSSRIISATFRTTKMKVHVKKI